MRTQSWLSMEESRGMRNFWKDVSRSVGVLCTTVIALALSVSSASAQAPIGAGTLGNLFVPREGKVAHYSSYDRSGGNGDARGIPPGQTLTLVDHKGSAGIVRRWWVTIAPRN